MQQRLRSSLGLLRVVVAASIALPLALFSYAFWQTWGALENKARAQIQSTLEIGNDDARTLFQASGLLIQAVGDEVAGLSDEEIDSRSAEFAARFHRLQAPLAPVQAVWLFDRSGHPLVNTRVEPNPRAMDSSDRDFFKQQQLADRGLYIGRGIRPVAPGGPVFVVSRRRRTRDGSFNGVIVVSLDPGYFRNLYEKISHDLPQAVALVRDDGRTLASFPPQWTAPHKAGRADDLVEERDDDLIAFRETTPYAAHIAVRIPKGAVWSATVRSLGSHLIFGVPATLALLALTFAAMRNTKQLYAEGRRREMAEAALKQTQRLEALGQLTGGVAHDINNLLMIVGGNAELAQKDAVSHRQQQRLAAIGDAVDRGRALTRQLLTFSRRQSVDPISTDLRLHLARSKHLFETSLGSMMDLRIVTADELWYVRVDRDELDIALLNLVVNAKDAMSERGLLSIEAHNAVCSPGDLNCGGLTGSFVALSVIDQGAGMSADVAERAFEPFFTTKPNLKGSGLGLSQVYGFCQQAGGTAQIRSTPRTGTAITLYLPRCHEAPADVAPAAELPREVQQRAGHALLVEDNAAVGELARDYLQDLGFEVTWAHQADAALQIYASSEGRVDLILSDIVMPGAMNGVQLARDIRRMHPRQPLLLMTGYSPYLAGATDEFPILRKPFTRSSLEAALARAYSEAGADARTVADAQELPPA